MKHYALKAIFSATIHKATNDGVKIDAENVVDLLADNFPELSLADIRQGLVDTGLTILFPNLEGKWCQKRIRPCNVRRQSTDNRCQHID